MSDQPADQVPQVPVIPLRFLRTATSEDGKTAFFEVQSSDNKIIWLEVGWESLSQLAHMLNQSGVEAAEKRRASGVSDEFTGVGAVQLVSGFRLRDVNDGKLRILSLHSPSGLRSDFALPLDATDAEGRSMVRTLGEGLAR